MKPTIAMLEDWVKGIELHAQKNYEKDGWDYIVECWEFKEILKEIKGCRTYEAALKTMHDIAKLHRERQDEHDAEVGLK